MLTTNPNYKMYDEIDSVWERIACIVWTPTIVDRTVREEAVTAFRGSFDQNALLEEFEFAFHNFEEYKIS